MSVSEQASRVLLLGGVLLLVVLFIVERAAGPSECLALPALAVYAGVHALRLAQPAVERFFARTQPYFAPFALLVSIGLLILGITIAFSAFGKLLMMLATLLAVPFGTIVYIAEWAHFPRGEARPVLALSLTLVLVSGALVVVSDPRVVRNVRLVIAFLIALLLVALVTVAHGWFPLVIVSITDAVAAIIVAIVGAVAALRVAVSQFRPLRGLVEKLRVRARSP
jgi:hypothetical protein